MESRQKLIRQARKLSDARGHKMGEFKITEVSLIPCNQLQAETLSRLPDEERIARVLKSSCAECEAEAWVTIHDPLGDIVNPLSGTALFRNCPYKEPSEGEMLAKIFRSVPEPGE